MASTGLAQRGAVGGPYSYQPLGYQQISSLGNPVSLTLPNNNATTALISVSGAGVRYRDDGVPPTALLGMPLTSGQAFQYTGDLTKIQFIQISAGAILDILYYA